jgi:pyruvate dehydrogenase E1 component alpha subunit
MWKSRDPIPTFTTFLQARNVLSNDKLTEIEHRIKATIDEAVEFATNAPDPQPEEAVRDLYA